MPVTKNELDAFHQFAEARLAGREAESLHELVDVWEIEQATPNSYASDLAAVRAAIRDMENGDPGRPAKQVLNEVRAELASGRET